MDRGMVVEGYARLLKELNGHYVDRMARGESILSHFLSRARRVLGSMNNRLMSAIYNVVDEFDETHVIVKVQSDVVSMVSASLHMWGIFPSGLGSSHWNLITNLNFINNLSQNDRLRLSRTL